MPRHIKTSEVLLDLNHHSQHTNHTNPTVDLATDHLECSDTQKASWKCTLEDNCGADFVCDPASESQFHVGEKTAKCKAIDTAGNSVEREVKVKCNDVTPPVILACPVIKLIFRSS